MDSRERKWPLARCSQMRQKRGLHGGKGKASGEAGVESRGHWRRRCLTNPKGPRVPALALQLRSGGTKNSAATPRGRYVLGAERSLPLSASCPPPCRRLLSGCHGRFPGTEAGDRRQGRPPVHLGGALTGEGFGQICSLGGPFRKGQGQSGGQARCGGVRRGQD